MNLKKEIIEIARQAKIASRALCSLKSKAKNAALKQMAKNLIKSKSFILKANEKDLRKAKKSGLKVSFVDRLKLNEKRIIDMADSVASVARLEDPVGIMERLTKRPNGLLIGKVRVPIGVICVIYESRPNVTADCIGLCLKSGNSVILRGGSEAMNSNIAIFDVLNRAAAKMNLPKNAINMVKTPDRKAVDALLGAEGLIDVIIPRGGESLIREVTRKSRIPVIKHYKGVCHVYVDEDADLNMAESIAFNAKVQRPGVCNAMETLLVHRDVAVRFLPSLAKKLIDAGVQLRGCALTKRILRNRTIKKAKESDWPKEYLELILSVKVVNNLKEAIDHISKYGTSHSDAIVTENHERAMEFLEKVDSSSVYVNASTRFTDGYEFGKGAEIGISTDKLHARGPMGLEELTTYKYVIFGNGQIRK
ncbi:MAG: glutamate-5-semialdehyde dehydrogenase [Candidatus Omnitrophica bacterium]|nr:glutamate-5-semialdehyde dehydrogenase [Candidatus Omnitrophota bacterium]